MSLIVLMVSRCTCVAGEVTTRIRCEIADDSDFCQCVVDNNGDQSQVAK